MVDHGLKNGIYKVAEENTLKDLNLFKSFLYRSFIKYEHCEEILPKSNHPGQVYGTAMTHKFDEIIMMKYWSNMNIDEITIDNLKIHSIITQTGTLTVLRNL